MSNDLDYLDHLARESARFGEAMREAPSHVPVRSCPDWNADDLLWHLGEVKGFWGPIVREKVTGPQAEELKPSRPAGRDGLSSSAWGPVTFSRTIVPQNHCTSPRCHNRSSAFQSGHDRTGTCDGASRMASPKRADSRAR